MQLHRVGDGSGVINARVRALRPEMQHTVEVRVVAPDISPGTFRSTPWGLLLRVVPENSGSGGSVEELGTDDAPVCAL